MSQLIIPASLSSGESSVIPCLLLSEGPVKDKGFVFTGSEQRLVLDLGDFTY